VWRDALGADAGICPLKILVANLQKKLTRGFEKEVFRSLLRSRSCARPNVQPAIRSGAEVNAFRSRAGRHGGINKRSNVPAVDSPDQLVVIAANEFDVVTRTAGHL